MNYYVQYNVFIDKLHTYRYNKIIEWEDDDEKDEDDDDEEETQNRDRKRKRTETTSENDMMMVVKFVLDAVFADTGLKWRSGEKTTSATKRSKLINELASSNNTNTNNIMGRRSDLSLRNQCGVDLCLVEFKNGSSLGDEIAQDSKSLRCTKSLYAYNSALSNKLMWSMNWSGKVIHETTMIH